MRRKQRQAAAAIRRLGGSVCYSHEIVLSDPDLDPVAHTVRPKWLPRIFGKDMFGVVVAAHLGGEVAAPYLSSLSELRVLNLSQTRIGDDGLKHIRGLRHLRRLTLSGDFSD